MILEHGPTPFCRFAPYGRNLVSGTQCNGAQPRSRCKLPIRFVGSWRGAVQAKNPKQRKVSNKRTGHVERTQGLLLDDFLETTDQMRRYFQLPVPQFGLKEMEQHPRAREALEMLIQSTIDRHGTEICARPHPLLSEISMDVYLERFVSEVYSGWRISPKWISQSLEKLLEFSLQTVSQLPKRDPKPDCSPRKLRLLASHLRKLGEEAGALFQKKETLVRLRAYFAEESKGDQARLLRIAEEVQWAANTLNATIAHTRLVKTQINSPNPQVRFALYIAGWFEASTGREQYAPLETLVTAAFNAAGKETPKWAGRLAIEMHLQRRRRQRHFFPHLYAQK